MADQKLRVIISAVTEALGFKQAESAVDDIGAASQGAAGELSSIIGVIGQVTAAAAIMGGTFKVAFDVGRKGAEITQTTESFGLLMDKVGAAPGLLKSLQEASRGTISDMNLMSSTASRFLDATGADLVVFCAQAAFIFAFLPSMAARLLSR